MLDRNHNTFVDSAFDKNITGYLIDKGVTTAGLENAAIDKLSDFFTAIDF